MDDSVTSTSSSTDAWPLPAKETVDEAAQDWSPAALPQDSPYAVAETRPTSNVVDATIVDPTNLLEPTSVLDPTAVLDSTSVAPALASSVATHNEPVRSPWAPPVPAQSTVESTGYGLSASSASSASSVSGATPLIQTDSYQPRSEALGSTSGAASVGVPSWNAATPDTTSPERSWSAASYMPPSTTADQPAPPASENSTSRAPSFPTPPSSSGLGYATTLGGSATSSPSTPPFTNNGSNPNGTAPSKGSKSWLKPALAGGLIGALVSSAVLGAALVTTRNNDNKKIEAVTASGTTPILPETSDTPASARVSASEGVPGILAKVQPSVVTINTKGFDTNFGVFNVEPQEGAGTGIILTADGYILTNSHVVANVASIKVAFPGEKGRKVMSATVVGRDPENDVAVVKIDGVKDLKPAKLGKSANTIVGESVIAVGNALGLPGGSTVTTGIISAIDRTIEGDGNRLEGLLQTDAAINPGNSGGPLVNSKGEVIGMNTAIIQNSNNIGFAIAIDRIKPIVQRIEKGGSITTQRTFLGVSTQTMDSTIQNQYGLATDTGALVVDVTAGSPADNLGLRAGDIITKFDGKTITDNKELTDLVRKKKPGNKVVVEWKRGDQTVKGTAELGSARSLNQG